MRRTFFASFFDDFLAAYHSASVAIRLIYINLAAFVAYKLLLWGLSLGGIPDVVSPWLLLSDRVLVALTRPWTLFTYAFVHQNLLHVFFNLVGLYAFGRLMHAYFSSRQVLGVYLLGVLAGALSFLFAPLFSSGETYLIGCSCGVLAWLAAVSITVPNLPLRFNLLGEWKLKYIAFLWVILDLIGALQSGFGSNHLAHAFGFLAGVCFALYLRRGVDLTAWMTPIFSFIRRIFTRSARPGFRVSTPPDYDYTADEQYNIRRRKNADAVDRILDKIRTSGYDSLTEEERKTLFRSNR